MSKLEKIDNRRESNQTGDHEFGIFDPNYYAGGGGELASLNQGGVVGEQTGRVDAV